MVEVISKAMFHSPESSKYLRFAHEVLGFLVSFIFSYLICKTDGKYENILSLLYVLYLFYYFGMYVFKIVSGESVHPKKSNIILFILLTHLGALAGFWAGEGKEQLLWVVDSYEIHIPGAVNIANFFHRAESLRILSSSIDRIYLTHWIVGGFFYLFGVSPIVSSLALMCVKIITGVMIFKLAEKILDKKYAAVATLVFATAPTVFFYTLSYYKVAVIQMLVICYCYFFYSYFWRPTLLKMAGSLICLAFMFNESVYLAPLLGVILIIPIFFSKAVSPYIKMLATASIVVAGWIMYKKYGSIYYEFSDPIMSLRQIKIAYNNYADINQKYNNLPFILSVIKFYLTPIFSFNKFSMFYDYSSILIWGSFFHQFIAICLLLSIVFLTRVFKASDFLLIIPFILFLFLFGYIAPYNGRLRDGFYPVICLFSSPGIVFIFNRLRGEKQRLDFYLFTTSLNFFKIIPLKIKSLFIFMRKNSKKIYQLFAGIIALFLLGIILVNLKTSDHLKNKIFWSMEAQNPLLTSDMGLPFFVENGNGRVLFSVRGGNQLTAFRQTEREDYIKTPELPELNDVRLASGVLYRGNAILAVSKNNEELIFYKYLLSSAAVESTLAKMSTPKGISNLSMVMFNDTAFTFYCDKANPVQCYAIKLSINGELETSQLKVASEFGYKAIVFQNKILLAGVSPEYHSLFLSYFNGNELEGEIHYEKTVVNSSPAIAGLGDKIYLMYIDPKTSMLVNDVFLSGSWRGKEEMVNYSFKILGDLFIYSENGSDELIASMIGDTGKVNLIRGHFLRLNEGLFSKFKSIKSD